MYSGRSNVLFGRDPTWGPQYMDVVWLNFQSVQLPCGAKLGFDLWGMHG